MRGMWPGRWWRGFVLLCYPLHRSGFLISRERETRPESRPGAQGKSSLDRRLVQKQVIRRLVLTRRYRLGFILFVFVVGIAGIAVHWLLDYLCTVIPAVQPFRWLLRIAYLLVLALAACKLFPLLYRSTKNRLTWEELAAEGIPICERCGYDLTGSPGPFCPECGHNANWFAKEEDT